MGDNGFDEYDDGEKARTESGLTRSNIKKIPTRQTAIALNDGARKGEVPKILAAGRGEIARKILQLAFEHGVRVREDAPLTEILAQIELDSPIPSEAFMAVAEILSYVYRANGMENPFDTVLEEALE